MERITKQIIDQQLTCYFISPHLDDAVLSAGDLIGFLSGKTKLVIVSVFTKPMPGPYSLSAKRFLKHHGYRDAATLYNDRKVEDSKVCEALNAEAVHLDFVDALWRGKASAGFLGASLKAVFPEVSLRYPTYRFHVVSGRIHPQDMELVSAVAQQLSSQISKMERSLVFCPAAVGGHVDHLLTRMACERAFSNLIFWKDGTYEQAAKENSFGGGRQALLWQYDVKKKFDVLNLYRSQIPYMFASGKIPEKFETYYINNNFKLQMTNIK